MALQCPVAKASFHSWTEVIAIIHYRRMQMVMDSVQQLARRLPCLYPNLPQACSGAPGLIASDMDKPANNQAVLHRSTTDTSADKGKHGIAQCRRKRKCEARNLQKMKSPAQVQLSGPTAEANVRAVLACFEALLLCVSLAICQC